MATDEHGRLSDADVAEPLGLVGVVDILRRWAWIVAPLVALTLFLSFVVTADIEPEYTAEATVLLVGPSEYLWDDFETGDVNVDSVNPLQQLGGSLNTVARVTVLSLSSPAVGDQLEDEGLSRVVAIGVENRSPIVWVEARHSDRAVATATANRMVELLFDDLDWRQDELNAPETDRITAQIISAGTVGGADYGSRTRVRLTLIAVGLILACGSAFVIEATNQYRARHQAPRRPDYFGELPSPPPQIAAGSGSDESFVDWASDHTVGLIATLQLLTGRRDTAEALGRQALGASAQRWDDIGRSEPEIWLYREALSYLPEPDADDVDPRFATDPLWVSLQGLDIQSRQAVAMVAVSQLPHDEIATILELSPRRFNALLTHASLPSRRAAATSDTRDPGAEIDELVDRALTGTEAIDASDSPEPETAPTGEEVVAEVSSPAAEPPQTPVDKPGSNSMSKSGSASRPAGQQQSAVKSGSPAGARSGSKRSGAAPSSKSSSAGSKGARRSAAASSSKSGSKGSGRPGAASAAKSGSKRASGSKRSGAAPATKSGSERPSGSKRSGAASATKSGSKRASGSKRSGAGSAAKSGSEPRSTGSTQSAATSGSSKD